MVTFCILLILFAATFVRSAFGFGEALIAVPLLALMMPVEVAAPVAVLVSITVAALILVQDWRNVHLASAGHLVIATVAGTPMGLMLLVLVPGPFVKTCLGGVIVAFSLYSLFGRKAVVLGNDRLAWPFGFGAGILGGAYGMNGPPLVIYGALRGWSPQHFRATLQGYFLPASLLTMVGYWWAGLWTREVTQHYLTALPIVLIAILAGRVATRRMDRRSFLRYIHIGLIGVGCVLLIQALV